MIIEFIRFLNRFQLLHKSPYKVWNRWDNSNMPKLTKKAISYWRTYGRTDPNYRKASLSKINMRTIYLLECWKFEVNITIPSWLIFVFDFRAWHQRLIVQWCILSFIFYPSNACQESSCSCSLCLNIFYYTSP